MEIKQYFTHYTEWEDWKNGMWKHQRITEELIQQATLVLLNPESYMRQVVNDWPICSRQNLTDIKSNRRSWLGQAACLIKAGCNEQVTRVAWGYLTEEQKENANQIALKIIKEWEKDYSASTSLMQQENV